MTPLSSPVCPERARPSDLPGLCDLEAHCFPASRRESAASLRRSLSSPHQEVWVMREEERIHGAMILRYARKHLRVYSVAVREAYRGRGWGDVFLRKAERRAMEEGVSRLLLEADASNERLLAWYRSRGYVEEKWLPDFYGPGESARRLVLPVSSLDSSRLLCPPET